MKYGPDTPLQLSFVSFSQASLDILCDIQSPSFVVFPALEPLDAVKDLAVIPRTPLLPSTPVFEDSPNVYDVSTSLCTPSLTCSIPALSSPISDSSTASLSEPRIANIRDFELLEFLSKGSSGLVYLARDNVSSQNVALKVIRKVAGVWDHPFVKQILTDEKKIMSSLQGLDWFVQLEASWHDTNNIYLAMVSMVARCFFEASNSRRRRTTLLIWRAKLSGAKSSRLTEHVSTWLKW